MNQTTENNPTEQCERAHHQQVAGVIRSKLSDVRRSVQDRHGEMQQIKQQLQDQIRDLDHADKANLRQAANMASRVGEFSLQRQRQLERLLDSPFFGRIDCKATESEFVATVYIGVHGFIDPDQGQLVYDWRAPISSTFYDFELGQAYYETPSGRVDTDVTLKRQYRIEKQQFRFMIESSLNILDDVLQEELSRASDSKLKTIVATIQRDQNAIIRNDDSHTLIIQGAAGSGKTSIAMHRIAYLLYKHKETITADDILIISPNNVFAHYISQVLPELGEEMIQETTMEGLADDLLQSKYNFQSFAEQIQTLLRNKDESYAARVRFKASESFLSDLDRYIAFVKRSSLSSHDLKVGFFTVAAETVQRHFQRRRNQSLREQLNGVTAAIVEQIKLDHHKTIMGKQRAELRAQLKSMMGETDLKKIYRNFFDWMECPEMYKPGPKGKLEYADVYPLIYLKLSLENSQPHRAVKHLVIDEMQDYSPVQYRVLSQLYPCKKTVLGDRNQAVNPLSSSCAESIRDVLPDSDCVYMQKSYRSTFEITQLAQAIVHNPDLQPIKRYGEPPQLCPFKTTRQEAEFLAEEINKFSENDYQSMAIICKTQTEADKLHEKLAGVGNVHLLDAKSKFFSSGIVVTTAYLAKGLEFDQVLVPFCNAKNYATQIERHMLYVAVTRAMHSLVITFTGDVSEFLEGYTGSITESRA